MKRLLLALATLCFSVSVFSQNKYVYNKLGQVTHIISDTLIQNEIIPKGGYFIEHHITKYYRIGDKNIGYCTTTTFITKHGILQSLGTKYNLVLLDKEVSKESMNTFLTFLKYVKEKYENSESYIKFDYVDESVDVMVRIAVEPISGKWRMFVGNGEYKIDALDTLIVNIEKLITDYQNLL